MNNSSSGIGSLPHSFHQGRDAGGNGGSKVQIASARRIRDHYPSVRVVRNPDHITSSGLNRAIEASRGDVIVRCDAHAVPPPGYVRRAVETMRRTGAAVVGGRQRPVGDGLFQRVVGIAMTTPLGAGDSRYKIGGREGLRDQNVPI